jgi:hypothetical protein
MHADLVAKSRCERRYKPGRAAQLHGQKERILEIFGHCFHGEIGLTVHVHLLCQRIRSAYWSTPACCIGSLVIQALPQCGKENERGGTAPEGPFFVHKAGEQA